MTTLFAHVPSPVGDLLLVAEADADPQGGTSGDGRGSPGGVALRGLYLPGHRRGPAVGPAWREDPAAFAPVRVALDAYFADGSVAFDVPLDLDGTSFQLGVWSALRRIPAGETVTYAELARSVGRPGAARAVGSAVARNRVSIVIPCHRVVGSDGRLTGYAGGVERKAWLLAHERAARPRG